MDEIWVIEFAARLPGGVNIDGHYREYFPTAEAAEEFINNGAPKAWNLDHDSILTAKALPSTVVHRIHKFAKVPF